MDLHSGFPFWLIKNGLPFSYPRLEQSIDSDVVVLGGGISGALVAYYLTKAGIENVVIDSRSIGLGSTCASTALLQYEIDTPLSALIRQVGHSNAVRAYHLGIEAIDELHGVAQELRFPAFEMKKSLYYGASKKDLEFIKEEYRARKENGINVEYLSKGEIKSEFGFSAHGGIYSQKAAQLDPYTFTHALHQRNLSRGTRVFDRTPIVNIHHENSGVTLHTENGHQILAKKIVYATGYEAVKVIREKIVDLHSTYATASEQFNEEVHFWKDDSLLWNTATPYQYLRTTKDRRIIIGGRDEPFYNPVKRDKLIDQKRKRLVKDFHQIFPSIEFKPEFTWTGTFGATKDGLPFIGHYKPLPNSYFALGFGGNGITFSVIAAKMITNYMTAEKDDDAGIFSFDRIG